MANRRILLPSNASNFYTRVRLDGEDYVLRFLWNDRSSSWYFTLFDSAGDQIQGATKLVTGYPLTSLSRDEDLFPGNLAAIDTTGSGTDPGLRDLNSRVVVLYEEEE